MTCSARLFVYILCVGSLLLSSCAFTQSTSPQSSAWCTQAVPALRAAMSTPPNVSAAGAASAGDLRYLEWYGIASAVPGVRSQQCAREIGAIKAFEGTSDALCSAEHGALYEKSYPYAEAYNAQMVFERKARGLKTCNDA